MGLHKCLFDAVAQRRTAEADGETCGRLSSAGLSSQESIQKQDGFTMQSGSKYSQRGETMVALRLGEDARQDTQCTWRHRSE
eukprot:42315-Eustigmatos_ZCMA.PRE.1